MFSEYEETEEFHFENSPIPSPFPKLEFSSRYSPRSSLSVEFQFQIDIPSSNPTSPRYEPEYIHQKSKHFLKKLKTIREERLIESAVNIQKTTEKITVKSVQYLKSLRVPPKDIEKLGSAILVILDEEKTNWASFAKLANNSGKFVETIREVAERIIRGTHKWNKNKLERILKSINSDMLKQSPLVYLYNFLKQAQEFYCSAEGEKSVFNRENSQKLMEKIKKSRDSISGKLSDTHKGFVKIKSDPEMMAESDLVHEKERLKYSRQTRETGEVRHSNKPLMYSEDILRQYMNHRLSLKEEKDLSPVRSHYRAAFGNKKPALTQKLKILNQKLLQLSLN